MRFQPENQKQVNCLIEKNQLSAKALAVLTVAITRGVNLSGTSLSEFFKEGRDSMKNAIKELKVKGYVKLTRETINGNWFSVNRVTMEGISYLSETLNIDLWNRQLVIQPKNLLGEFPEQLSTEQKIEIANFIKQEIKKVTEGS
jgi:hypothetical protein